MSPFKRRQHQPEQNQDSGQPEHLVIAVAAAAGGCLYSDYHHCLGSDGWQHATLYHDMLCWASQGIWATIAADHKGTDPDGNPYLPCLRGHVQNAPLTGHPSPLARAGGHIAIAVAAHEMIAEQSGFE